MMNWLRRFMAGRYGVDQLQWTLLGIYLALSLLLPSSMWRYLALIPLVLFRAMCISVALKTEPFCKKPNRSFRFLSAGTAD